jgi:hypothetical protein
MIDYQLRETPVLRAVIIKLCSNRITVYIDAVVTEVGGHMAGLVAAAAC